MYTTGTDWNYTFAQYYEDLSIVATERIIPYGITNDDKARKIYGTRLVKLLKRAIAFQYFGYKISSDPTCLTYSPMMSTTPFDRMKIDYCELSNHKLHDDAQ